MNAKTLGVVKVLGPGCPRCHETKRLVINALEENSLAADVQNVTDFREWAKYEVMFTPAVIINDEVLCQGRIPTLRELKKWFADRAPK